MEPTGERYIFDDLWGTKSECEHRHRYAAAEEFVHGKTVLDAACGTGYGSYSMAEYAESVMGIDISDDAIIFCKEQYKRDNLSYSQMSVVNMDLPDNSFDVVISFETIEHLRQGEQVDFLKEIVRVLKPDGILIMSSPNREVLQKIVNWNWVNEYHIYEYATDEFEETLRLYFTHVKLVLQNIVQVSTLLPDIPQKSEVGLVLSSHFTGCNPSEYVIAVCSNKNIDQDINKLYGCYLPNIQQYYQETFLPFISSCLYLDRGIGFVEEHKLTAEAVYKFRGQFSVTFRFSSKGVQAMRFDPCERMCKIQNLQITGNVMCTISGGNYDNAINDEYCFLNTDPFLELSIESLPEEQSEVVFNGKVLLPNYKDFAQVRAQREENLLEQANLVTQLTQKTEDINSLNAQLTQKTEDINSLNAQMTSILNSRSYRIMNPLRKIRSLIKSF